MLVSDDLARLVRDGILRRDGGELRTTRRWQGAMARAAAFLVHRVDVRDDLRLPIAIALMELYPSEAEDIVAQLVEALLPIEARELYPALAVARAGA